MEVKERKGCFRISMEVKESFGGERICSWGIVGPFPKGYEGSG